MAEPSGAHHSLALPPWFFMVNSPVGIPSSCPKAQAADYQLALWIMQHVESCPLPRSARRTRLDGSLRAQPGPASPGPWPRPSLRPGAPQAPYFTTTTSRISCPWAVHYDNDDNPVMNQCTDIICAINNSIVVIVYSVCNVDLMCWWYINKL